MSVDWKEFELLVAQIENHLAPKDAEVKSPDRIRDKVTGQMREVDASIRYKIGSASILITIECRNRSRVQGDMWIEQIASKREKIGANKTIAVSSEGFSKPATISADKYGIELRRIEEITDDEISNWFKNITIEKLKFYDEILEYKIEVDEDSAEFSEETKKIINKDPFKGAIFIRAKDNVKFSVKDLLNSFYKWQQEGKLDKKEDGVYTGLKESEDKVKREFKVEFPPDTHYVFTNVGKSSVLEVKITLQTHIKREEISKSEVYKYSSLEERISQIAVGTVSIDDDSEEDLKVFVQ